MGMELGKGGISASEDADHSKENLQFLGVNHRIKSVLAPYLCFEHFQLHSPNSSSMHCIASTLQGLESRGLLLLPSITQPKLAPGSVEREDVT